MDQFIEQAKRTESGATPLSERYEKKSSRLLHAGMGLATESAEFLDALKKFFFYNKTLDFTNLKEELGDILWYVAIAMDALDTDFEKEMTRVINKLRTRYPEKFTNYDATHRDLLAERKVLDEDNQHRGA